MGLWKLIQKQTVMPGAEVELRDHLKSFSRSWHIAVARKTEMVSDDTQKLWAKLVTQ
jgi:hypothetical protein